MAGARANIEAVERAPALLGAPFPSPGDVLGGRYRIERPLGRGGMGAVFEAEHLGLARRVAIKVLATDARDARARFLREARSAARLEGEHVVRVVDVGEHEGLPFLAMELLVGQDLHTLLQERGPLPVDDAVDYVFQACEGLAEAHAHGIVHRDLKPSNLFLARRADGTQVVKLLDFGIAKAPASQPWSQGHLTGVVEILGSPPYMSPEHLRDAGSVDARTDLWSLGVVLHELVTGTHPFEGETPIQLGARIALEAPVRLTAKRPAAPRALEQVILRCLEKDPAARYQTVAELARALLAIGGRGRGAPDTIDGRSAEGALSRIHGASLGVTSATMVAVPRPASRPPPSAAVTASGASAAASSSAVGCAAASQPGAASGTRLRTASSSTERFRRQHEELHALGLAILERLARPLLETEASEVRKLVARFAGKLSVHASMENEALYPRLLHHPDANVRARAGALFDEVGSLYATFGEYAKRWPASASIAADPSRFAKETRDLMKLLATRMMREDAELYPLVDEADTAATR